MIRMAAVTEMPMKKGFRIPSGSVAKRLKAAPGFRTKVRSKYPGMMEILCPSRMERMTIALVTWSVRTTASAMR